MLWAVVSAVAAFLTLGTYVFFYCSYCFPVFSDCLVLCFQNKLMMMMMIIHSFVSATSCTRRAMTIVALLIAFVINATDAWSDFSIFVIQVQSAKEDRIKTIPLLLKVVAAQPCKISLCCVLAESSG